MSEMIMDHCFLWLAQIIFLFASTSCKSPYWWPSLALILASHIGLNSYNGDYNSFTHSVCLAMFLRLMLVSATLAHEASHTIAAAVTCQQPLDALFSIRNILGNVPLSSWLYALCPLLPWPENALSAHVILPILPGSRYQKIIRISGPLFSFALAFILSIMALKSKTEEAAVAAFASWVIAFGAVSSDILELTTGKAQQIFYCGNFGMLVICAMDRYGIHVPDVLREMAATTAARGGQAGGLVTLLPDGSAHRTRYVPSKRADVAKGLMSRFFSGLWLRTIMPSGAKPSCRMFLGHTRFATSSKPSTLESHPHRFSYPKKVRVWRPTQNGWASTFENFEVYVTHNGDFDYYPLFGRVRTQREIGMWLKRILGATHNIPGCDSVKVAGVMELLRTQGIWEHSLRLAFQLVVSPPFEDTIAGSWDMRRAISCAAAIADKVFEEFSRSNTLDDANQVRSLAEALSQALTNAKDRLGTPVFSVAGLVDAFAAKAVACFLDNDLFSSLVQFLGDAQGSFGITTCCTLDRNVVCIASRGQAMCVSFNEDAGVVLWGSEAATQMVPITKAKGSSSASPARDDIESGSSEDNRTQALRCTHRHDLDESGGEVMEIAIFPDPEAKAAMERVTRASAQLSADERGGENRIAARFQPFASPVLNLRVYKFADGGMVAKNAFTESESFIALQSDMIDVPLSSGIADRVAADLNDIPRVLSQIRADWKDENGRNRRTASEFFRMIKVQLSERSKDPGGRLEADILVTGVEASLWIGEQFASDLQTLFPSLRVVAISANKIVGVLSNTRGSAPMAGFAFSSLTLSLKRAIVVAISHSGQTFPTLHATHALKKVCGDRLFVLSGSIDSKMSSAIGQYSYPGAPWIGRVLYTFSGWRSSEALTVSTVACHHTLSELLLYLAKKACREDETFRSGTGFKFPVSDVLDITRLNESMVSSAAPSIVGVDVAGNKIKDSQVEQLRDQGNRWALHILETPYAWILSAMYICATIISGKPLFSALRNHYRLDGISQEGQDTLTYIALILDSVLYCFLPLFFSILLRIVQRRPLTARLGKRTIVIGDVPYVNQLIESYVSKLFACSYSIASVDVHGANAVDHLVHRFTHRVVRGLLIAVGRPDGRLFSLTKAESWVLMALQQCKSIVHLMSPPEVVTVGHNPYVNSAVIDHHLVLEKNRPNFFCEVLSGVQDTEPMKRAASIRAIASQGVGRAIDMDPIAHSDKPLCSPSADGKAASRDQSLHMASQLQSLCDAAAGVGIGSGDEAVPDRSIRGALVFLTRDISLNGRRSDISEPRGGGGGARSVECSMHGPHVLDRALERATGGLIEVLNRGSLVEMWYENRYGSLERYMAFLVMFHAMAAKVAAFFPLQFDIARSQSQLRVATTAAPISAAEIEKEWAHDAVERGMFQPREIPPDPTLHMRRGGGGRIDKSGHRAARGVQETGLIARSAQENGSAARGMQEIGSVIRGGQENGSIDRGGQENGSAAGSAQETGAVAPGGQEIGSAAPGGQENDSVAHGGQENGSVLPGPEVASGGVEL